MQSSNKQVLALALAISSGCDLMNMVATNALITKFPGQSSVLVAQSQVNAMISAVLVGLILVRFADNFELKKALLFSGILVAATTLLEIPMGPETLVRWQFAREAAYTIFSTFLSKSIISSGGVGAISWRAQVETLAQGAGVAIAPPLVDILGSWVFAFDAASFLAVTVVVAQGVSSSQVSLLNDRQSLSVRAIFASSKLMLILFFGLALAWSAKDVLMMPLLKELGVGSSLWGVPGLSSLITQATYVAIVTWMAREHILQWSPIKGLWIGAAALSATTLISSFSPFPGVVMLRGIEGVASYLAGVGFDTVMFNQCSPHYLGSFTASLGVWKNLVLLAGKTVAGRAGAASPAVGYLHLGVASCAITILCFLIFLSVKYKSRTQRKLKKLVISILLATRDKNR